MSASHLLRVSTDGLVGVVKIVTPFTSLFHTSPFYFLFSCPWLRSVIARCAFCSGCCGDCADTVHRGPFSNAAAYIETFIASVCT